MLISDVTIFIKIDELSWKKFFFFLQEIKYISQLVQYNQNLENRKDTKWGVGKHWSMKFFFPSMDLSRIRRVYLVIYQNNAL